MKLKMKNDWMSVCVFNFSPCLIQYIDRFSRFSIHIFERYISFFLLFFCKFNFSFFFVLFKFTFAIFVAIRFYLISFFFFFFFLENCYRYWQMLIELKIDSIAISKKKSVKMRNEKRFTMLLLIEWTEK